jgi:mannitol operon transcriptional antiterminator
MNIIQKYTDVRNEEGLQKELKQYLYKPVRAQIERQKPSLNDLLKKENIQLQTEVKNWEEAIWVAAEPLKQDGSITDDYINAMVQNITKMGPYIVIAPKVAIPHARPEDGVNKLGLSFLKLAEVVPFSDKEIHDVQLVIVLAAIDGDTHLKAISQLTNMLTNKENIKKILEMESSDSIFEMVKSYSV